MSEDNQEGGTHQPGKVFVKGDEVYEISSGEVIDDGENVGNTEIKISLDKVPPVNDRPREGWIPDKKSNNRNS